MIRRAREEGGPPLAAGLKPEREGPMLTIACAYDFCAEPCCLCLVSGPRTSHIRRGGRGPCQDKQAMDSFNAELEQLLLKQPGEHTVPHEGIAAVSHVVLLPLGPGIWLGVPPARTARAYRQLGSLMSAEPVSGVEALAM